MISATWAAVRFGASRLSRSAKLELGGRGDRLAVAHDGASASNPPAR